MEKYKIGTVFELYENENQEYLIVNNIEKEKNIYLLIVPVYNVKGKIKANYEKVMLLNVDKETDEIEIETNEKIIAEVVDNTIQKSEEEKN